MSERERRVDELFDRVLDAPPDEREEILAAAGELRGEVESLLEAHEAMGDGFLAVSAGDRLDAGDLEPGDRVGRYTVRRRIAAGGSGTVYEAEQDQPHRTVALKVMHAGITSDRARERFAEEAEILARLDHPGIATVYEAGVEEGVAYIAMELLSEVRMLNEFAAGLDRDRRLALFAEVCDAVHHGHQQGIIHRDLKPANVLVKSGRPRVVDFGIARAMGRSDDEIAGTMPYMSPEQCTPGAHLDVRSDVYSLGVMLHELLGGELPYDVPTTSITDAARAICETPPHPLGVSRDLDAVVAKALAKDAGDRYVSAAALAEDLRRYRVREPVTAQRAGPLHLLALWIRRRPGVAASLAALLVVLVAGVVVSVQFAVRAEQGRARAEQETYRATVVAADAALRIHDVEGALTQLALSPAHLRNWEWRYLKGRADVSAETFVWPEMMIFTGRVSAGRPRAIATASGGVRVWDVETGEVLSTVPRKGPLQSACALSPDGKRFLVGDQNGGIRIRETASGAIVAEVEENGGIWCLGYSRDGDRFAAGVMSGVLSVWEADGAPIRSFRGREGTVTSVAFFPDGRRIAAGGQDREIRILDLRTGEEVMRLTGHGGNVESMAISPDGELLVAGSFGGEVRIWETASGRLRKVLAAHTQGVKAVAFAPDGSGFASGALDHTVRLWSPEGEERGVLVGHATMIRGLGYTPDSARLVSFGRADRVKVWDVARPGSGGVLTGLDRRVQDLVFAANGDVVAVSTLGHGVRWTGGSGRVVREFHRAGAAALTEMGEGVVFAHPDIGIARAACESGEPLVLGTLEKMTPYCIAANPSAGRFALGEATGRLSIWSFPVGPPVAVAKPYPRNLTALAFTPDGRGVATASQTGPVFVWSTDDGRKIRELPVDSRPVRSLAFSPDGRTLAAGGERGTLLLLDVETRSVRARLEGHNLFIAGLAFSPDGSRLASASHDGTVRIWDPARGVQLIVLRGHRVHASCVAWSPDGRRLASGGGDHGADACEVRIWDAPPMD